MSKVPDTPENVDICVKYCGTCKTYPGVEGEALFCARGKSTSPKERMGCNCPSCEVQATCGLTGAYYCIEGSAE
jgi:hypothetical protein